MKPLSLYIDTSILGGYFDLEFTIATRELWRQMEKEPIAMEAGVTDHVWSWKK
jgi:hypothetical protein